MLCNYFVPLNPLQRSMNIVEVPIILKPAHDKNHQLPDKTQKEGTHRYSLQQ